MPETAIAIREINPGETESVCALIRDVFTEFVAPHFADEGVKQFLAYVDPEQMAERMRSEYQVLLAEKAGELVAAIEIRRFKHISLLFVAPDCQRQGIARQLITEALNRAYRAEPDLSRISVHASPNSVLAYEALGFHAEGPAKEEYGIRYIPMSKAIRNENDG